MCLCAYNMGVELEHLHRWEDCIRTYSRGLEAAAVYLGEDDPTTDTLRRSLKEASKAMRRAQGGRRGAAAPKPKPKRRPAGKAATESAPALPSLSRRAPAPAAAPSSSSSSKLDAFVSEHAASFEDSETGRRYRDRQAAEQSARSSLRRSGQAAGWDRGDEEALLDEAEAKEEAQRAAWEDGTEEAASSGRRGDGSRFLPDRHSAAGGVAPMPEPRSSLPDHLRGAGAVAASSSAARAVAEARETDARGGDGDGDDGDDGAAGQGRAGAPPPRRLPSITERPSSATAPAGASFSPEAQGEYGGDWEDEGEESLHPGAGGESADALDALSTDRDASRRGDVTDRDASGGFGDEAGQPDIPGALVVRSVRLEGAGAGLVAAAVDVDVCGSSGAGRRDLGGAAATRVEGGSAVWAFRPVLATSLRSFGAGSEGALRLTVRGETAAGAAVRAEALLVLNEGLLVSGADVSDRVVPLTSLRVGALAVVEVAFLAEASVAEARDAVPALVGPGPDATRSASPDYEYEADQEEAGGEEEAGSPSYGDGTASDAERLADADDDGYGDEFGGDDAAAPHADDGASERRPDAPAIPAATDAEPAGAARDADADPEGAGPEADDATSVAKPPAAEIASHPDHGSPVAAEAGPDAEASGEAAPIEAPDGRPAEAGDAEASEGAPAAVAGPAGGSEAAEGAPAAVVGPAGGSADAGGTTAGSAPASDADPAEGAAGVSSASGKGSGASPQPDTGADTKAGPAAAAPAKTSEVAPNPELVRLVVTVDRGTGFVGSDGFLGGKQDPYVTVRVLAEDGSAASVADARTATVDNDDSPTWGEDLDLAVRPGAPGSALRAVLTVMDEDTVTKHDVLGTATVDVTPWNGDDGAVAFECDGASMGGGSSDGAKLWARGVWKA